MRVAIVCQRTSPWSREAAARIQELGNEVHVIDFASPIEAQSYLPCADAMREDLERFNRRVAGIHLIRPAPRSQARYVLGAPVLRRLCKQLRIQFVLNLWGGGLALMSYLSGVRPYGVFLGGGDVLRVGKSWPQRLLTRRSLRSADLVLANGEYLAEAARAISGADVRPLYYGVDAERFRPRELASDARVGILCTRGFEPVYNNEALVRALGGLADHDGAFEVTFTARGSLFARALRLADDLLPERIRQSTYFLNGVTDDGMVEALQRASIFVSMARYDGTSISLLEALACGLFPILSDIPQNREWIRDGRADGILVPLDDDAALAAALKMALADTKRRERARRANRDALVRFANSRETMSILARYMKDAIARRGER